MEPRQFDTYQGLLAICRARVVELNWNYTTLDVAAGYTESYSTKLLADNPQRHFSPESFDAYLGALCFDLVAIPNPEKLKKLQEKLKHKLVERKAPKYVLTAAQHSPIIFKLSRRHMKKIAKLSAAARMVKIPKKRRRQIARKAARARWHPPAKALATHAANTSPAVAPPPAKLAVPPPRSAGTGAT